MKSTEIISRLSIFFAAMGWITAQGNELPNIILINADDLGYGDLSCYGASHVETPNIDKLAAEGRRYTDAHSASAVCSPSRYGLLTGRYPSRRNIWGPVPSHQALVIDTKTPTIASVLKNAGYQTACIGKWHLGFGKKKADYNKPLSPGPNDLGFDYYFGIPLVNSGPPYVYVENTGVVGYDPKDPFVMGKKSVTKPYPAKGIGRIGGAEKAHRLYDDELVGTTFAKKSVEWIAKQAKDKPYFLYVATTNIHHPFTPARQFVGTSKCGIYGDFIHELDWMVGELVKAADERGDLSNTLVIFTSDNGGMLNEGGQQAWKLGHRLNGELLGFKFGAWEGGHRIPLVMCWPGKVPAGSTSGELVSHLDLIQTFASLTVQAEIMEVDSTSLLSEMQGKGKSAREELIILCNSPKHLGIRTKKWLYIPTQNEGGFDATEWGQHLLGGAAALKYTKQINSDVSTQGKIKKDAAKVQLYDLEKDPYQSKNIALEFPEVVKELDAKVQQHRAEIPKTKTIGWISPQ